jgi:ACS family hexuronate transporter-like MFS transporter
MGAGFGGMLFSLVTGWLVERYSFSSAFLLFSILPLIAAGIVWTLPQHRETRDPDPIPGPAHA